MPSSPTAIDKASACARAHMTRAATMSEQYTKHSRHGFGHHRLHGHCLHTRVFFLNTVSHLNVGRMISMRKVRLAHNSIVLSSWGTRVSDLTTGCGYDSMVIRCLQPSNPQSHMLNGIILRFIGRMPSHSSVQCNVVHSIAEWICYMCAISSMCWHCSST